MSINPSFGAAPDSPYVPDNLIAGDATIRTETVRIKQGQVLKRGAVLGIITAAESGAVDEYVLSLATASDDSEDPVAILAIDVDATAGAVEAPVYIAGDFNERRLILGAGHDLDSVKAAFRGTPLFIQPSVHN